MSTMADLLDRIAAKHAGHVTLMRFSTGWKVFAGTPELTPPDRARLDAMPGFMDLGEAVGTAALEQLLTEKARRRR